MTTEDVTIEVGGLRLRGFQEINITRSMKNAAISFAMTATNPAWHRDAFALRFGKDVTINATGTLMLKGDIDTFESELGEGDKREVRVSGRSRSGRAVDSPPAKHKTGRIENKTLLDAAKEFDEFGVGWRADVPLKPIEMIQRHPLDSSFETIERYARQQGLMLAAQPEGDVLITRGSDKRHAGELAEGMRPVKSLKITISQSAKANPAVVRNQRRLGTDAKALRQEETVYDPSLGRYRPAIVLGENDQSNRDMKNRGEWGRLRQGASGLSATATVYGWRDSAGEIWTPGKLIFLRAPSDRIEQDMRLESVTFTQGEKGTIAQLTLVDPKTSGAKGSKAADGKNKSDPAYKIEAGNLE